MSTVCIDFDGVLAQYDGWKGEAVLGDPAPGALDFVRRLLTEHYRVIVHTTRDSEQIRNWLREHGLRVWTDETCELQVWNEKPPALVYIDDRGFRFTGDWEAAYEAITEPPWWQKPAEASTTDPVSALVVRVAFGPYDTKRGAAAIKGSHRRRLAQAFPGNGRSRKLRAFIDDEAREMVRRVREKAAELLNEEGSP